MAVVRREIPDDDHLMRFVPFKEQVRDPDTNEFLGIATSAFKIRPSDGGGVSVTWIEYYGGRDEKGCTVAAEAFRENLPSKKLGAQSCFAVGIVGKTKEVSKKHGKQVRVVHAPDGPNEGHVELRQFDDDDRLLLDAFAQDVFCDFIMTKDLNLA